MTSEDHVLDLFGTDNILTFFQGKMGAPTGRFRQNKVVDRKEGGPINHQNKRFGLDWSRNSLPETRTVRISLKTQFLPLSAVLKNRTSSGETHFSVRLSDRSRWAMPVLRPVRESHKPTECTPPSAHSL